MKATKPIEEELRECRKRVADALRIYASGVYSRNGKLMRLAAGLLDEDPPKALIESFRILRTKGEL